MGCGASSATTPPASEECVNPPNAQGPSVGKHYKDVLKRVENLKNERGRTQNKVGTYNDHMEVEEMEDSGNRVPGGIGNAPPKSSPPASVASGPTAGAALATVDKTTAVPTNAATESSPHKSNERAPAVAPAATAAVDDSSTQMELQRHHSNAKLTDEPSPFMSAVTQSFRVFKARFMHGINEDVDQFQDEIEASQLPLALKDKRRIEQWLDTTIQSFPPMPFEEHLEVVPSVLREYYDNFSGSPTGAVAETPTHSSHGSQSSMNDLLMSPASSFFGYLGSPMNNSRGSSFSGAATANSSANEVLLSPLSQSSASNSQTKPFVPLSLEPEERTPTGTPRLVPMPVLMSTAAPTTGHIQPLFR